MIRQECFNAIETRISFLATRIELRGGLNILDLNIHSENFYPRLLNLIFGWNLVNLNTEIQNATAIDLVDRNGRLVAQVSATGTKQKINSTLAKDLSAYTGHGFKFVCITRAASQLRTHTYENPHALVFAPQNDIHDCQSLLAAINGLPTEKMETIRDFLRKELKVEIDPAKVESNLATIVKSINEQEWTANAGNPETIPFDIEGKITFNQIDKARALIDDYKLHHHRLAKIYAEYDRQGRNKSLSILDSMRRAFLELDDTLSADDKFFRIIAVTKLRIAQSANAPAIPDEELELCVAILVVDAFIRCKIFKNPERPTYASS
ncbi:ABC-three component system protein [Opitutus terrae]|uniref:SMEK domain-containing protein n=1 Tax=Opitutus terrae (strain DSM 11246 / JCM 15787 / PB90-1) TaxID=452637 RepID=B1ZRI7_OPITP|nr:ABC-three component system protein [Opitutus terrae]ACB77637.1 conserved hypothetical protein [Opitutus terrae PB90-1]